MLNEVLQIAREAGAEILEVYQSGHFEEIRKDDDSPVTRADLRSNDRINRGLKAISTDPIISEENPDLESLREKTRSADLHTVLGPRYWLVDPLDGTREFIQRKDNFVVSIALIESGFPVMGVLYAPVSDLLYWAERGQGAWCNGQRIYNSSRRTDLVAVASGSHQTPKNDIFAARFGIQTVHRFGSALKFARVAEGSADLYARFGATSEWDVAAGHAILKESGCKLVDVRTQEEMRYGKADFLNGPFIASRGDLDFAPHLQEPPFLSVALFSGGGSKS